MDIRKNCRIVGSEVPRFTNGTYHHLKRIRISGRVATTLYDLRVSIPDEIKVQHPEEE